nr:MAG TPA: Protein of unknown function (DUF2680) [Caudoviricetes sp.]DAO85386.1 MAG TPA: Protein of unknown function (DUF2680) [Caudoviricetes sp.]DAR23421.1 MAG TPA: Protein of unknown function (DUF2680) [Caudoviricetes sp.]
MSSSLYNSMGRQTQNPIGGQFQQFMGQIKGQMQGRNPQDVINQMVSTGQLSQQQLNAIQQRAQQIAPMLNGMKNMFGF